MQYTRTDLEQMSLNRICWIPLDSENDLELIKDVFKEKAMNTSTTILQLTDIRTKWQEDIIQEAINHRKKIDPQENFAELTNAEKEMLDSAMIINNPSIEKELQSKLNERRGLKKEESRKEENVIVENIVDTKTDSSIPEINKSFCNFCDSKGVRHKKTCTRLVEVK